MTEKEKNLLELLWKNDICPSCGKTIMEGKRVGSGQKSRGGFCSLDCYAEYHKLELLERAKLLAHISSQAKLN